MLTELHIKNFALFVSSDTPKLFAIDNVDASLNPKLCTELMRRLVVLAKKCDKQVLITTHNPAVLDGLDLNDDEQRLFMVYRNSKGHTRARRVRAPKPLGDEPRTTGSRSPPTVRRPSSSAASRRCSSG